MPVCEEDVKYYSFRCPDGGAIACNPCKNKMCRFTPVKEVPESDDLDEKGDTTAELRGDQVDGEKLSTDDGDQKEQGEPGADMSGSKA